MRLRLIKECLPKATNRRSCLELPSAQLQNENRPSMEERRYYEPKTDRLLEQYDDFRLLDHEVALGGWRRVADHVVPELLRLECMVGREPPTVGGVIAGLVLQLFGLGIRVHGPTCPLAGVGGPFVAPQEDLAGADHLRGGDGLGLVGGYDGAITRIDGSTVVGTHGFEILGDGM